MENWIECQPDFWLPTDMDCSKWPAYDDIEERTFDLPNADQILQLGDLGRVPAWAWRAWGGSFKADKKPTFDVGLQQLIAERLYQQKRFRALVPVWRQWLIKAVTSIDDIEDQVSTILWIAEILTKKIPPLRGVDLGAAQKLNRLLDDVERGIAGVTPFRGAKAEWRDRHREAIQTKRRARTRLAKLVVWLQQNWGRLLEAAQATGTWFDVGIVLGPVMGFIEEMQWGLAKATVDNYLIATDALLPGYRDSFYETAERYGDWIDKNVFDPITTVDWDEIDDDPFEF
jgi:hypothetical protein